MKGFVREIFDLKKTWWHYFREHVTKNIVMFNIDDKLHSPIYPTMFLKYSTRKTWRLKVNIFFVSSSLLVLC